MPTSRYTIRDDGRYTVIVGWEAELETFFARVFAASNAEREPLLDVGTRQREISAVSLLAEAVSGYAPMDGAVVTALRHDAARPA